MLDVPAAASLVATLFVVAGGAMIVDAYSRKARSRPPARYREMATGVVLVVCGLTLLIVGAASALGAASQIERLLFWLPVGIGFELPAILVCVRYWPDAIRWGQQRQSLNPRWPFLAASFWAGLVIVVIVALVIVF